MSQRERQTDRQKEKERERERAWGKARARAWTNGGTQKRCPPPKQWSERVPVTRNTTTRAGTELDNGGVQTSCAEALPWGSLLGDENSARSFSDRSFLSPPSGRGRPRLRVMDVRTEMLVFPGFPGPDRSFCPPTSAGISAWTSAGYPAPKLTLGAAFSFLNSPEGRARTSRGHGTV